MKSAHEICGCLDGVRCRQAADRDRLMGMVNSAENRARLAEDRERMLKAKVFELEMRPCSQRCDDHCLAADAQEPRT